MRGVCDSAVPVTCSRLRVPPCCLPVALTPSAHLISAISELINFRDTQTCIAEAPKGDLRCLFPTLQVRRYRTPSQGSRSEWFATPFLCDSFIHYFTPVYPDAIQSRSFGPTGEGVFFIAFPKLATQNALLNV